MMPTAMANGRDSGAGAGAGNEQQLFREERSPAQEGATQVLEVAGTHGCRAETQVPGSSESFLLTCSTLTKRLRKERESESLSRFRTSRLFPAHEFLAASH